MHPGLEAAGVAVENGLIRVDQPTHAFSTTNGSTTNGETDRKFSSRATNRAIMTP